nr:unnamed protein product [Digitaria exilis]
MAAATAAAAAAAVSVEVSPMARNKAFCKNVSVRVANELGAGSGKGARFAIVVSITTSVLIGIIFWCVILYFNDQFALLFTSSKVVLGAVHKLSVLLAFTVLLNSVQPVLSGKSPTLNSQTGHVSREAMAKHE